MDKREKRRKEEEEKEVKDHRYGYMYWVVWNLSIVLYGNYGSMEVQFWTRKFRD